MLNLSKIPKTKISGKILRSLLKIIPSNTVMTIKQGSLKGSRWIKGSGVNTYWLGNYEKDQQDIFQKLLKSGDVFYDIGANVGFYSLLASSRIGASGKVYTFEPVPRNINYVKKHFTINNCKNAIIISGGVSNKKDIMNFEEGDHPATGSISNNNGNLMIPTFDLDNLVEGGKILPPTIIKIDVEGEEFNVLEGAKNTLRKFKPIILLATHNPEVHKKCLFLLRSMDYKLESIDEQNIDNTSAILAK